MKKLLIFLVCAIITLYANAQTFEYEGLKYSITSEADKTCEIAIQYADISGDITIPETVTYGHSQYAVTSIAGQALSGTSITSITLPESLTSIGDQAFFGCSSLMSITLSESLESIGVGAFSSCSSLTSITLPSSLTSIGGGAFQHCSSLTSITLPSSLTSIGEYVFSLCKNLTSINVVPENKNYASIDGVLFSKDLTMLIAYPGGKTGRYTVPEGVTSIGDGAFICCYSLTSINLPEGITSIGDGAFYSCESLASINLPEGITSIGDSAFAWCRSLIEITLPKSLISIGSAVFITCDSLKSINVSPENKNYASIDGILFSKDLTVLIACHGGRTGEYAVPNGVISIGDYAFYWCRNLTSIDLPESLVSIGDEALFSCSSLTSITLPESLTSIGDSAFGGCSSLTTITLPESLTSLGNYAFGGCSSLTSIALPGSLTSIGDNAFGSCSSLTSITLPESLTSLGNYAFGGCSSLTSITLPEGLTSIGNRAFAYCENLTTVKSYAINPPECFDNNVFFDIPSDAVLHVPVGCKADYAAATGWSVFNTIVDDLDTTGVDEFVTDTESDAAADRIAVYNLQGVRMNISRRGELPSLPAGIYIVNGKKIFVK